MPPADATTIASAVVASSILVVLVTTFAGFSIATQIEAARATGAANPTQARTAVTTSMRIALSYGLPAVAAIAIAAPLLTHALADETANTTLAATYLRITLIGTPFAFITAILRAYATALGRTRIVLIAGIATATIDIGISIALVPLMGWAGVATGTVAGFVASAIIMVLWCRRLPAHQRPQWQDHSRETRQRLLHLGWPEALLALFSSAASVVVVLILAGTDSATLAAARTLDIHILAMWTVLHALGRAQVTILAELRGSGHTHLLHTTLRRYAPVFAASALALCVLGAPLSPNLVALVAGTQVADVAGSLGWLWWSTCIWMAASAFATAICRSLGDTRASLIASLVGEYAVFLPLGLLLCQGLGWGLAGVGLSHHAFWITFAVIAGWRARLALRHAN